MQSPELAELSEFALQTMQLAARTLGLDPSAEGQYVRLGAGEMVSRCVILDIQKQSGNTSVRVGVEVMIDAAGTRVVRSVTTGTGRSAEEAVLQGVQVLIESGLPPIIQAFAEPQQAPSASGVTTIPGGRTVRWQAFSGPAQAAGKDRSKLLAALESNPIIDFYGSGSIFGERPLTWLQTCMYRGEDGRVSFQCTVNERPWAEAEQALQNFPWPESTGYLFLRQFHMIKAQLL